MFGKASIFAFYVGCIFISACVVPQDRYFEIEDKYTETRVQMAEGKYNYVQLEARNKDLNDKIRNLEDQVEKLKKEKNEYGGIITNAEASKELLVKINKEIQDELGKEIGPGGIQVDKMQDKIKITFGNNILFDKGTAEFYGNKWKSLLNKLAKLLKEWKDLNVNVWVEGHTDANPIDTDEFPSNWELSAARAAAVVRYLEGQDVDPERLTASGRAASSPLDNYGKYDDANRRVEIYILPKP